MKTLTHIETKADYKAYCARGVRLEAAEKRAWLRMNRQGTEDSTLRWVRANRRLITHENNQ
jgi:hypothetical protein